MSIILWIERSTAVAGTGTYKLDFVFKDLDMGLDRRSFHRIIPIRLGFHGYDSLATS